MAQIIASGITDATSSDIVVSAPVTISLFWTTKPRSANVKIDVKGSDGSYMEIGSMSPETPIISIVSPGTYRVRRISGGEVPSDGVSFGVDQT